VKARDFTAPQTSLKTSWFFPISLGNRATASKRDAGISSRRLIASKRDVSIFKRDATASKRRVTAT